MALPTLLLRAQSLDVAYEHVGWCISQRMTLPEIAASIGLGERHHYTLRHLINVVASEWRVLQRDPVAA